MTQNAIWPLSTCDTSVADECVRCKMVRSPFEDRMGKYDPLEHHLRRQTAATYEMTFRDIERVLSALLPKSARRSEWWANEQVAETRHVQCKAWIRAGYRAVATPTAERVRFERAR